MDNNIVIVTHKATSFANHVERLGMRACIVRTKLSEIRGMELSECAAIYWTMETMCHVKMRHVVRSLLLSIPTNSMRILDFNLKEMDGSKSHLVTESLMCCDMLKIDQDEFARVCKILGKTSPRTFDNGFELMRQFSIETLILTHGTWGCHVFHGSAVSEKWGMTGFGNWQSEEAESAFLAAYFVASRQSGRLFTECHRRALDYMRQVYEKKLS